MLQAGEAPPEFSNLEIRNYATTLRDFGAARDLIQARWANIDFSSTNLILRPESNYSVGTSYEISADTPVNVSDLDAMTYSAEMSDFVSTDVRKISGGKNVVIFDSCVYLKRFFLQDFLRQFKGVIHRLKVSDAFCVLSQCPIDAPKSPVTRFQTCKGKPIEKLKTRPAAFQHR